MFSAQEPAQIGPPGTTATSKTVAAVQQKQQELLKSAIEQPFIPKDPPAEFEFIADPPSISALDLYVFTWDSLGRKKGIFPM